MLKAGVLSKSSGLTRFVGKVIAISGGASGIGKATVERFADEGASVLITDVNKEQGNELAKTIQDAGGKASFVMIDSRDDDSGKKTVEAAVSTFGKLDIVFANAGLAYDAQAAELPLKEFKRTIDVNLTGVFNLDQAAIQYWLKNNRPGIIVQCSSILSWVGTPGLSAYCASKGGVKLLTQSLALEYAAKGIRVNAVCPGYIETPLLDGLDVTREALAKLHPIGRIGEASEIASVVAFLSSDDATFVNGASILVDGGYVAK